MRRIVLTAAALVLGLSLGGTASAHEGYGHGGYVRTYHSATPYYQVHGRPYHGGYYYAGPHHSHWEHRVWSPEYRRYHYWDPYLHCYYYYSPEMGGYYPVP